MRVDSHQHFWRYTPEDYPWIAPDWQVLQHDFLPDDLRPLLAAAQLDGAIAVQAQQTIDETRWLLDLAADHPDVVKGVVGWVPLIDSDVDDALARLVASPTGAALKGIRHILQGEADDAYMLRDDFNRGVARLRAHGLTYDILIYGRHLANAAAFVDRHPDQVFVLDHIAKPEIRAAAFDRAWAGGTARTGAAAARDVQTVGRGDGDARRGMDARADRAVSRNGAGSVRAGPHAVRHGLARLPAALRVSDVGGDGDVVHLDADVRRTGGDHGRQRHTRLPA